MLQDRIWILIGRKMADEASQDELKELEAALRADPELHFSMQAMADIWQRVPSYNTHELEAAYREHVARMTSSRIPFPTAFQPKKWQTNPWLFIAAALLLVIAGASYYIKDQRDVPNPGKASASEISTRNGSKTNIVLPDGTKVWLNAGSKLIYNKSFGENNRDVTLTGEAYFDVTHNAEKPFVIHTRSMDVKVLGTEFNVKSYPEDKTSEASLIHGSLEVVLKSRQADKIVLKPNEKLIVTNEKPAGPSAVTGTIKMNEPLISVSHLNYFSRDSTILETSWVRDKLVFEDESFSDLARQVERWYGVSISFDHSGVDTLHFTGSFSSENIQQALNALRLSSPFNYSIRDNNIQITSN